MDGECWIPPRIHATRVSAVNLSRAMNDSHDPWQIAADRRRPCDGGPRHRTHARDLSDLPQHHRKRRAADAGSPGARGSAGYWSMSIAPVAMRRRRVTE